MKLIVAGSRNLHFDCEFLARMLCHFNIPLRALEIVSGGANGIDSLGIAYSQWMQKPVSVFKADWDKHGRAAGPIRNKEMAEFGDALLLIWDGESRGSSSMKREMAKLNKPIFEVLLKKS